MDVSSTLLEVKNSCIIEYKILFYFLKDFIYF